MSDTAKAISLRSRDRKPTEHEELSPNLLRNEAAAKLTG
jgi:hypothetical protein